MRSVRAARRLRVLCVVLTCFVVVFGLLGVVGGVVLAAYHQVATTVDPTNPTLEVRTTSFPYVVPGVALGVGSLFVALVMLALVELFRIRAAEVIEDRGQSRGSRRSAAGSGAAASPAPVAAPVRQPMSAPPGAVPPPPPPPAAQPASSAPRTNGSRTPTPPPPRPESPGRRVRMLTEDEKQRLAAQPPSSTDPGWYPDPLAAAQLRRWNGLNWTGEQQPLVVPRL